MEQRRKRRTRRSKKGRGRGPGYGRANTVSTHTAGGAWHPQTVMLITLMWISSWFVYIISLFLHIIRFCGLGNRSGSVCHQTGFQCPQPGWCIAQREMGCGRELSLQLERSSKRTPEGIWWLPLCVENRRGKDTEKNGYVFFGLYQACSRCTRGVESQPFIEIDLGTSGTWNKIDFLK